MLNRMTACLSQNPTCYRATCHISAISSTGAVVQSCLARETRTWNQLKKSVPLAQRCRVRRLHAVGHSWHAPAVVALARREHGGGGPLVLSLDLVSHRAGVLLRRVQAGKARRLQLPQNLHFDGDALAAVVPGGVVLAFLSGQLHHPALGGAALVRKTVRDLVEYLETYSKASYTPESQRRTALPHGLQRLRHDICAVSGAQILMLSDAYRCLITSAREHEHEYCSVRTQPVRKNAKGMLNCS